MPNTAVGSSRWRREPLDLPEVTDPQGPPFRAIRFAHSPGAQLLADLPSTDKTQRRLSMRPVQVTVRVPQPCDVVYDFLDVLSNHELFTDHFLRDWHCDGPARGIGSRARVTAVTGGRADALEMEVIDAQRPLRTVERNVSLEGRRVVTGTYTLAELSDGGTRVSFESSWEKAPLREQLASPVIRLLVRRLNERAMQRLAEQLEHRAQSGQSA